MTLKNCPFCGKPPTTFQDEDPCGPGGPIPTDFVIECRYCRIEMSGKTESEVSRRWNKRQNLERQ